MKEYAVQFGERNHLVGNVTIPLDRTRRTDGQGLILINAGIVHRIGPHRINVRLARHAANLGVPCIRFDLSGRGDSAPGQRQMDYRQQSVGDIRAALETLESIANTRRYSIFGICSGADDAYAAALAEPRIAALALFDPYIYPTLRWRVRIHISKLRKFGLMGALVRLKTIRRVQKSYEDSVLENYGRQVPLLAEYAAGLAELAARGVRLHLIYSGSSVDQADYYTQRRKLLTNHGLDQRIESEFLADVDHVITSIAAQQRVLSRLETWLGTNKPVA